MELAWLTEEEAEKICEYVIKTRGIPNEKGLVLISSVCQYCPFGIMVDNNQPYVCGAKVLFRELPLEFEKLLDKKYNYN